MISSICTCGHRPEVHEANECWTDLATGEETWTDAGKCPCPWYEPLGMQADAPTGGLRTAVQDRGASAVEYGLLVAAVAAVIVGLAFAMGGLVRSAFAHTNSCIVQAQPGFTSPLDPDGKPVPPADC